MYIVASTASAVTRNDDKDAASSSSFAFAWEDIGTEARFRCGKRALPVSVRPFKTRSLDDDDDGDGD